MTAAEDESTSQMTIIDETYEFSAPRFFDFIRGETADDEHQAELWFENAISHAPSPFMLRIKTGRSVQTEVLCDFNEAEKTQEAVDSKPQPELVPAEVKEDREAKDNNASNIIAVSSDKKVCEAEKGEEGLTCSQEHGSVSAGKASANVEEVIVSSGKEKGGKSSTRTGNEACTPKSLMSSRIGDKETNSKKHQKHQTKMASFVRNPSALKLKNQLQSSHTKTIKPSTVKKDIVLKTATGTPHSAQDNQSIKRQKLEGEKSRQILGLNSQNFPHKTKLGLTDGSSNLCFSAAANRTTKEGRKLYVREPVAPFISTAEMMKKFQSSTRDMSLPQSARPHTKGKLTLTIPKEPDFETAQRVRSVKIKSFTDLEEEMMAKIPKFKARPVNKKILNAPTLPALPRSAPQPPEFREFHLETMARAHQNAEETASAASVGVSHQNNQRKAHHLTEPRTPVLHTLLRARPPMIKSSIELEQEELEKAPKFKARPLNKKIFESKGELGIFSNAKKHVTIPREFHFATNERIPLPAAAVVDLFDMLSLNSESHHQNPIPRNTKPNPFHLHTEERGAEKERRFITEVVHKQIEEERARVHKANPYPYTTDYPTIPPKPEPKKCTKPEPFQLESLVRHEEEMQREMEERQRLEREAAQMRIFKAQPILKEDPLPVPEKARKPLTEVKEFNLFVDNRAVERAEFDQKIKEKEMMYKRYREESEAARMIEEEKALKQMRRTMVPHVQPLPKFDNPFFPKRSSKEATKPKSPNLRLIKRREMRKHLGGAATAASSPATCMR